RRFRTARPARCGTSRAPGIRVRSRDPAGDSRPLWPGRIDQCRLHHTRSAREQGLSEIVGRRAPSAARWPPSEVLCVAACGCRGAAPGVPCLQRDGGRPPEPAGAEVKKTTNPPPLAIWLLNQRLPAEWYEFVVGDLEEEFAT